MADRNITLQAIRQAGRELKQLDIDQSHPIDIFGLVYKLDLDLTFKPLRGPSGAFVPAGRNRWGLRRAGMLINAGHP